MPLDRRVLLHPREPWDRSNKAIIIGGPHHSQLEPSDDDYLRLRDIELCTHIYETEVIWLPTREIRVWVDNSSSFHSEFNQAPVQHFENALETYLLRMQDATPRVVFRNFHHSEFLEIVRNTPYVSLIIRFNELIMEAVYTLGFMEQNHHRPPNHHKPPDPPIKEIDCDKCEYGLRIWSRLDKVYLPCSLCGSEDE